VTRYPVLLVTAFFGTLGTSASETAPFLPIDQTMIAQVTAPEQRTSVFARYNLVASFSAAAGALAAGVPGLLTRTGLPLASGVRLMFGVYAVLALIVAVLSLRLSLDVEAPPHRPIQVQSRRSRLVPPLHRSRGIVWRLTALFSVDALAGGLVVQSLVAFAPTFPIAATLLLLRQALSQMDVPTRQAYTMALVAPEERTAAASVTSLARSVGSSTSPFISGLLLQGPLLVLGLPFILAGTLKAAYDLTLWSVFRRVHVQEAEDHSLQTGDHAEPPAYSPSEETGASPEKGRGMNS
jgi:MFS family permease